MFYSHKYHTPHTTHTNTLYLVRRSRPPGGGTRRPNVLAYNPPMVYVLAPLIRVGRCPAYRPRSTFVHSFTHVLRSAFTTFIHSVDVSLRSRLPPFTYTHLHTRPPLRIHTHALRLVRFPVHHPMLAFARSSQRCAFIFTRSQKLTQRSQLFTQRLYHVSTSDTL